MHYESLHAPTEGVNDGDTWDSPGMRVRHVYRDGFWIPSKRKSEAEPVSSDPEAPEAAAITPPAADPGSPSLLDGPEGPEFASEEPNAGPDNGSNESDPPAHNVGEGASTGAEGTDANGSPVGAEGSTERPLDEDEIARLTEIRRRQVMEELDKERDDSKEQK